MIADFTRGDAWFVRYHHLCRRAARKFSRPGVERADLEQVAAIGLLKAGRRYDTGSQIPFEAYAWQLIVGELMHYVRDYEHLMRVPRGLRKLERDCWEAFERLAALLGREPRDDEVAQAIGARPEIVSAAKRARLAASPASLEHEDFRERTLRDAGTPDQDRVTERVVLEEALATLAPAERNIVVWHYVDGRKQDEIAQRLGLSKRQVARLQYRALERMRAHLAGAPGPK